MENNNLLVVEKRLVARFLDMFIRFGLILALASFCYTVFSPFLNMMLWAVILAVTLYPLHQYFATRLGGKQGWSSTLIVLLGIVLIVVPTVLMISSLGESVSVMIDKLSGRAFVIPPPSAHIATIPIVGEKISVLWLKASNDLPGLISNYRTQIGDIAKATLGILASMGGGLLGFILSFIVAGIIMTWGAAGADSARRIAIRLTDENKGQSLVKLCTSTIRAVAQGVIGVALIQAGDQAFGKLSLEGDEATGANIVRVAIEAPLKQIAVNAGLEGGVVAEKVGNLPAGEGLNAATGEYVKMVDAGIIDPAKVTRSALQNAASIAALFLTTEAVIADKPEKAAPMPGGDGGMGGMDF